MNNKLKEIIGFILGTLFYCTLCAMIIMEFKVVYGFIFVTAAVILYIMWKHPFNLIKLWAIIMFVYSILILLGFTDVRLMKETSNNPLVALFVIVAKMFAYYSSKVMIIFWSIGIVFVKPLIKYTKIALCQKIHGRLPNVHKLAKGRTVVYISKAGKTNEMQLIYSSGKKKKILDTYNTKSNLDPEEHYSLEWVDDDNVVVRKYDVYSHNVIMEKEYRIPHC